MFHMMRLRLQIQFWRMLGQLAIWLRDTGQRCYAWYEQHSPMKIVVSGELSQMERAAWLANHFGRNWTAYTDKWDILFPPVDPGNLKPEDRTP